MAPVQKMFGYSETHSEANCDLDALVAKINGKMTAVHLDVDTLGAKGDGVTDDSGVFQEALNSLLNAPGHGGVIDCGAKHYRVMNLKPPVGVSFVIQGMGETATILSPPAATPVNPIFDLTSLSGPAKCFRDLSLNGANKGLLQSTGILMSASNGVLLDHVWMAGLLIGVDYNNSSYLHAMACTLESCGTGFLFRSAPTETQIINPTYYRNNQDIQVTGNCTTFSHSGGNSIGCVVVSVKLAQVTTDTLSMESFRVNTALLAFRIDNSDGVTLQNVVFSACGTDYATAGGVTRLYLSSCNGSADGLIGAGVFIGTRFGLNQREFIGAATPVAGNWLRGDRVWFTAPIAAAAPGTVCVVAGGPGTWQNMAELAA